MDGDMSSFNCSYPSKFLLDFCQFFLILKIAKKKQKKQKKKQKTDSDVIT